MPTDTPKGSVSAAAIALLSSSLQCCRPMFFFYLFIISFHLFINWRVPSAWLPKGSCHSSRLTTYTPWSWQFLLIFPNLETHPSHKTYFRKSFLSFIIKYLFWVFFEANSILHILDVLGPSLSTFFTCSLGLQCSPFLLSTLGACVFSTECHLLLCPTPPTAAHHLLTPLSSSSSLYGPTGTTHLELWHFWLRCGLERLLS